MIKMLSKLAIKGISLKLIKSIYKKKPSVNIIINDETQNVFPLKSGTGQGCLLSLLLFNIMLETLANK